MISIRKAAVKTGGRKESKEMAKTKLPAILLSDAGLIWFTSLHKKLIM